MNFPSWSRARPNPAQRGPAIRNPLAPGKPGDSHSEKMLGPAPMVPARESLPSDGTQGQLPAGDIHADFVRRSGTDGGGREGERRVRVKASPHSIHPTFILRAYRSPNRKEHA